MTWRRAARSALFVTVGGGLVAGCATVPSPAAAPSAAPRPSASPSPSLPAPPPITVPVPVPSSPSASGFAESTAVACAGRPGPDRVIALLSAKGVLSGATGVTVRVGPLCAGVWQYTVLAVPGREPLQVVTEGPPDALRLVTAGTDVCSVPVRTEAPAGIVAVAHC